MTPPDTAHPDAEAILGHSAWVHRLARKLVRDPELAEDLAQDALAAACVDGPREPSSIRAWLARVVRHRLAKSLRSDERRVRRERVVSRREAEPSAAELVERAAVHRDVVEAVMALREPYRQAILMRYLEGRPPRQIATQLGLPVRTVKTRLARGLAELRARLDRTHGGGRGTWALALAPLARPSGAKTLGVLIMSTPAKLVPAALVVAVGVYFALPDSPSARPSIEAGAGIVADDPAVEAPVDPAAGLEATGVEGTEDRERTPIEIAETADPGTTATPPAPPLERTLRGVVVDVSGFPQGGVLVRYESSAGGVDAVEARTSGSGAFELDAAVADGHVVVADDRLVTVFSGSATKELSNAGLTLVVAPRLPLGGRVVDVDGNPISGADVVVEIPAGVRSASGHVMDFSRQLDARTKTDGGGAFALPDAPAIDGARIDVSRGGYTPVSSRQPGAPDEDLLFVLQRPNATEGVLTGVVVDPTGQPVQDALVTLGMGATRTNERGVFLIDRLDPNEWVARYEGWGLVAHRLVVVKEGHQPGILDVEVDAASGEPDWPETIVIEVGPPPLSITGTVRGEDGSPRAGMQVWVMEAELLAMAPPDPPVILERLLAGTGGDPWNPYETDEDGRFAILGLRDRDYTVVAMDPATLAKTEKVVAAGRSDVRVEFGPFQTLGRVAGRVVNRFGDPVAGVTLEYGTNTYFGTYQGQNLFRGGVTAGTTVTDESGTFDMGEVSTEAMFLMASHEDAMPGGVDLRDATQDFAKLEIEINRRMSVRVELERAGEADEIAVLDPDGTQVVIRIFHNVNEALSMWRIPVADGRTDTFTVPEYAETLVLYRGGEEIRRAPLVATPGDVNVVTP